MFGYVLNTYGLDLKSIHHLDFHTHQFPPVGQTFPNLSPYPHGDTEDLVFVVPYDNIYDISESIHPHIISRKFLHHIGRKICDPHHNFVAIKGTDCAIDYIKFSTLWEGICKDLFSFSDFVCRSECDTNNNHLDNSPLSSDGELQGVSPLLLSCRFCTLAHDHGVHNFFIKFFYQN